MSIDNTLLSFVCALVLLTVWVVVIVIVAVNLHGDLARPLRRTERAKLFLDVLEVAINAGQSPENTVVALAKRRDKTFDKSFYKVAGLIEKGVRIGEATKQVPRFLSPQISAMLQVGEKLGDLKRVFPACRELLKDTKAPVQTAIHYVLVLAFVFSPLMIIVTILLSVLVFPKMIEIAAGEETILPFTAKLIFEHQGWIIGIEIFVCSSLLGLACLYVNGPRLFCWLKFGGMPVADRIAWRVPWKRKRLQQTFSAMLAVLLDGGVPETEAVRLAGDCTVNEIGRRRAQNVISKIESGIRLDQAVAGFDETGEFRWRLSNAIHAHGGFLKALRGWHESLDAKAFQQQETTAHVITSGLVVLNGLLVALITTSVFGMLIAILNGVSP